MAWIRSLTGIALLTLVASSVKAAPPSFVNHGDQPIVLVEAANYESLALPISEQHEGLGDQNIQEAIVENRKFFRPHYLLYPYILSHPNHPLNNPYPELAETPETEDLANDGTPIAAEKAEDAETDDNEEIPETIEIPQAYENEPETQLNDKDVQIADREHEDVLAVNSDERNVDSVV